MSSNSENETTSGTNKVSGKSEANKVVEETKASGTEADGGNAEQTKAEGSEKKTFKSIRDMKKAIEKNEAKITYIQPQNLALQQESFNIKNMVENPSTEFFKIREFLQESLDNLKRGYEILMNFYGYQKRQKQGREDMAYQGYQLGDIEFLIVKRIGYDEDISPTDITPNRMGMIVTIAAHNFWVENITNKKENNEGLKVAKKIKGNIINPFALAHGFEIDNFETASDPGYQMAYINLVTTIGFDALTCYNPVAATGIAAYRASPGIPEKLGLDKGIPEGANKEHEIKSRCLQGILTKTFSYGGIDVKLEDLLDNKKFMQGVIDYRDFLIAFAKEPIKSRDQRAKKVFGKLTEGLTKQNSSQRVKDIKKRMFKKYNIKETQKSNIMDPFEKEEKTVKTETKVDTSQVKKEEAKVTPVASTSKAGTQSQEKVEAEKTIALLKKESEDAGKTIEKLQAKKDGGETLTEAEVKIYNDAGAVIAAYNQVLQLPVTEEQMSKFDPFLLGNI